ncbi:MAG: hypothetical protein JO081_11895 [Alphaproteobacteria bacterium]|nr:hypothetical protein [Alphaproteobacteria bacterium]
MTIIRDVLKELLGMFLADARLTIAILLLVAVVAGVISALPAGSLLTGGALLFGCLAILVEAVSREARTRQRR